MTATDYQPRPVADLCQAALQAALPSMEAVAPGCWRARANRAAEAVMLAQLIDGFLILTEKFSPATPPSRWELLKANATLMGLAKFSAVPGGGLFLRAEIPVQAESDLSLRISQARSAFAAAHRPSCGRHADAAAAAAEAVVTVLPNLVEAAGWGCPSRNGDVCVVPLETRQEGHTAVVTASPGAVRLCADLVSWDSLPVSCRDGLASMLLTANARLRLARAIVVEEESGGAAQLEVFFQTPVAAAELRSALEALSVGADTFASAADLLQGEAAAKRFLAFWGGPQASEDTEQRTERNI